MIGVVLQARLSSSRLPNKALLPLAGRPVIEHAMSALRDLAADRYVLATDHESAAQLEPVAAACGFEVFAGDPEDVLARFAGAVRRYRLSTVVRATGDNPAVSTELAAISLRAHLNRGAEYTGLLGPPLGTCVEVLDAEALLRADREAVERYDREHVAPFIYHRPEQFRVFRPELGRRYRMPEARVTLDTYQDYERLVELYRRLYRGRPIEVTTLLAELLDHTSGSAAGCRKA